MNYGKTIIKVMCIFSVVTGIKFPAHAMKRAHEYDLIEVYVQGRPMIVQCRPMVQRNLYFGEDAFASPFVFPSLALNEYYRNGNFAPIEATLARSRFGFEKMNQNNNNNNL